MANNISNINRLFQIKEGISFTSRFSIISGEGSPTSDLDVQLSSLYIDLTNGSLFQKKSTGWTAFTSVSSIQPDWNETNVNSSSYILNKPTLAAVATSGDYTDLNNLPTTLSDFTNDLSLSDFNNDIISSWALASTKPTYSYSEITGTPTLATVATSGSYSDLTGTPDLSDNATKTWVGQQGYLTAHQSLTAYAKTADLATVATSGSYSDLTGKPTNLSDFTNDSSFITLSTLGITSGTAKGSASKPVYVNSSGQITECNSIPTVYNSTVNLKDSGGTVQGSFTRNVSGTTNVTLNGLMTSSNQTVMGFLSSPSAGNLNTTCTGTAYYIATGAIWECNYIDFRINFTAGESITAGNVVCLNSSGQVIKAQCSTSSTRSGVIGVSQTTASSGQTVKVTCFGNFDTTTSRSSYIGKPIFLSTTAGGLTTSMPSSGYYCCCVGYVTSAYGILVRPSEPFYTA